MENGYGLHSQGRVGAWNDSAGGDELQEGDVWGVYDERFESDYRNKNPISDSKRLPSSAAARSKARKSGDRHHSSAPVNVPDWSKIYGSSSSGKPFKNAANACLWQQDTDSDGFARSSCETNYEEDEEDEDGNVIPPHEWLARKLARNKISSFSVCEGAGRTLKGRDLSRVRNAVLTRTGFLESK